MTNEATQKTSLLFVTGQSGAGISTTMDILEDFGYAAFDNFPLSLIPALLEQEKKSERPIAIAIDTRARNFDPVQLSTVIRETEQQNIYRVKTVFLSADDPALLKRFNETRRVHPLARDRSIADGIVAEKALLAAFKHDASYIIDTSDYSIHDLRRVVEGFADGLVKHHMTVSVMSFSFKYGLPREADLVFDVRFLRNPNWVAALKNLSGLDPNVQNYVREDGVYDEFLSTIQSLLDTVLPRYAHDGKSYLTVAFGCTGGRHRSVTLAEDIGIYLRGKTLPVHIYHREIREST